LLLAAIERSWPGTFSFKKLPAGAKQAAKDSGFPVIVAESVPPGLKPTLILLSYAGVKTPASLRIEFLRYL
jgi:hypothetical protein